MEASARDRKIEDSLLRHVFETGRGFYLIVLALLTVIAFGGLIAAFDRRYRSQSGIRNHSPSAATTPSVGI